MIPTITPADAQRLVKAGAAVLVDIREPAEHARERIAGAKLVPLSSFDAFSRNELGNVSIPIFHCQGGRRTQENAERLVSCGAERMYLLEGGLTGWRNAGLATVLDRSKPIELQRQVQIAAGGLVLLGLVLAVSVSAWFAMISMFVGCGLVFAGISGWCGMARLLQRMPWNRVEA